MASLEDLALSIYGDDIQSKIAENNPYFGARDAASQIGQLSLGAVQKEPTRYSTKDILLTTGLSGLVQGLFGGLGNTYQQKLTDRFVGFDPDISKTASDAGLPAPLFTAAQNRSNQLGLLGALTKRKQEQELQASLELDSAKTENEVFKSLYKEMIANPSRRTRERAASALREFIGGREEIGGPPETPPSALDTSVGARREAPTPPPAIGADEGLTLEDFYNQYDSEEVAVDMYQRYLDKKDKEQQRSEDRSLSLRDDIDKYLIKADDEISFAEGFLSDIKSAVSKAGTTGSTLPLEDTLRRGQLAVRDAFGDDAAEQRRAARGDLESLNLSQAVQFRNLFKGQTTELEFQKYLEAGVGLHNIKATNERVLNRLNRATEVAKQKRDFIAEAGRHGLSLTEAQRMFSELNNEIPLFKEINGRIELNPDRERLDVRAIPFDALKGGRIGDYIKKNTSEPVETAQELSPQTSAPQITTPEQQAVAQETIATANAPRLFGVPVTKERARQGLTAAATAGDTALFGLPRRAVGLGNALMGEAGELVGLADEKSFSERYNEPTEALRQAQKDYPVTSGVSELTGLFTSPVNKLKAVQAAFKAGGLTGVAARVGTSAAISGADTLGRGEELTTEKATNAALLSAGIDVFAKGASKLRGPAKQVFHKLSGVTATDMRKVVKETPKAALSEAKKAFSRAYGIIKDEFGIKASDLAKADETVHLDFVEKAMKATSKRNTQIEKIIKEADKALKGGASVRTTQLDKAIKNAGAVGGDDVANEGTELVTRILDQHGNSPSLAALQAEKKALNRSYKPAQSYLDAKTAVADDLRETIVSTVDDLVKQGKLPKEYAGRIRKLNLEERDLMRLRDAHIGKLPASMAEDFLSTAQRATFTTGGAGLRGASIVGAAAGGQVGSDAAVWTALLAYSKRIGRPVSYLLSEADDALVPFLESPELRTALSGAVNETFREPEKPLNIGGGAQPDEEYTRGLFGEKKTSEIATETTPTDPNAALEAGGEFGGGDGDVERKQSAEISAPINFPTYAKAIAHRESRGWKNPYRAKNRLGFVGKYQLGMDALIDLGLVDRKYAGKSNHLLKNPKVWLGGMTLEKFYDSPELQEELFADFSDMMYKRLLRNGAITKDSTPGEIAGAMAAAHLKGQGGAYQLIVKGIDNADANDTKASSYYKDGMASQEG